MDSIGRSTKRRKLNSTSSSRTEGAEVSGVGVLDKAVAILTSLESFESATLGEIVEATDISRPTAHRLLVALETHGLAQRDSRGRFRLGMRLATLGAGAIPGAQLASLSQPVLRALRDATGESAQIYVRDGDVRICIASAERLAGGLRDTVAKGIALPLDRGSAGKVLLAFESGQGDFAPIRRKGWAESVAEREEGVASVSAPVFDQQGELIGAVSVSGPIDRMGKRPGLRFSKPVLSAAGDISALLTHR